MPPNIKRLRMWFAAGAITLVVIVACFYLYGRIRARRALGNVQQKLGIDIQQSTAGFTLSKSQGGHTVFRVHASKAVQYKQGGRAELHDVSIVVYGRDADRFDQIYGSDFEYDPQSGNITAQGEVQIDLEGNGQGLARPDQAVPPELKNPIHVKTSGLQFNQKTGMARTDEDIEFRIPQATGSATGAVYDANLKTLTLESNVRMQSVEGSRAKAHRAVLTTTPRQAKLTSVDLERSGDRMHAENVVLFLRADNSIDHILATGDVRSESPKSNGVLVRAPQAEVFMGEKDAVHSAVLSGGVSFEQGGDSPMHGTAAKATVEFGRANTISRAIFTDGLKLVETPKAVAGHPAQQTELDAGGANLFFARSRLARGETTGAAQIVSRSPGSQAETVSSAARFEAIFDPASNRAKSLHGAPDAKIVSRAPNQQDRVSTSLEVNVGFNRDGSMAAVTQNGDVQYVDGERRASAQQARYDPTSGDLTLTGSPRFSDQGLSTTANTLHFNQRTGDASAQGSVKTSYNDMKPQPGGAMLATADPVHVTADRMTARRATSAAEYSGGARLWQGSNLIQAPQLSFDRNARMVTAEGTRASRVITTFVQPDKSGRIVPVNVTAAQLVYHDAQRTARYTGQVIVHSAETTLTCREAKVLLLASRQTSPVENSAAKPNRDSGQSAASQVDRIVAEGGVVITEPGRKAAGDRLVYTASDGKYVMTGGPPSIFDAEHGSLTGDSLTFFSRDGRVLVGGATTSLTVTDTRDK
ncbi:MAG: LPS export ABC transporter periplasmic protein LptC [Acidobacteria bacterium]|nr:LPS export ABC transporter periplasmic protein LptC [Acidobacteriota bacterium]